MYDLALPNRTRIRQGAHECSQADFPSKIVKGVAKCGQLYVPAKITTKLWVLCLGQSTIEAKQSGMIWFDLIWFGLT